MRIQLPPFWFLEIFNIKPPLVSDLFSEFVLEGCLSQLDVQPQMVYKVCELLTTCAVRNGVQWRDHMLTTLINEVRGHAAFN